VSSGSEPTQRSTARVEIKRVLHDGSETTETIEAGTVDYARDRSDLSEPSKPGTRVITIGHDRYVETGSEAEYYDGNSWLLMVDFDEAEFEQSLAANAEFADVPALPLSRFLLSGRPAPDAPGYLDVLHDVGGEFAELGAERVRGVSTRRYRGVIDLQRTMRRELIAQGWKATNVERYIEPLARMEAEVDAWIDADGLTRRVVTKVTPVSLGYRGGEIGVVTTTEFFDFGLPADIQPPSPEAVADSRDFEFEYYVGEPPAATLP
jgi:hypothetical protein